MQPGAHTPRGTSTNASTNMEINTEYKEAYQWREPIPRTPTQSTQEHHNTIHVDPSMYKSTSCEAYKPYAADAYRAQQHEDEVCPPERIAVDPDMYKSTSCEAYKPYAADAISLRDVERAISELSISPRPSIEREACDVGRQLSVPNVPCRSVSRTTSIASCMSSVRSDRFRSNVVERSGSFAVSFSRAQSGRHAPRDHYVTTKAMDFGPPPVSAYTVLGNASPVSASSRVSAAPPSRKVDADHFVSSSALDYKAPSVASQVSSAKSVPSPSFVRRRDNRGFVTEYRHNFADYGVTPVSTFSAPLSKKECVHHVDPSFYTTSTAAAFVQHTIEPRRSTYTKPIPTVRHVSSDMYITSSMASFHKDKC